MQLKRAHTFDDIKGHQYLTDFFVDHLQHGTLPQFIILHGPTGVGKTSYAEVLAINLVYGLEDSSEKEKAIKEFIDNKKNTEYLKRYELSVEGGKDTAREMVAELRTNIGNRPKVILADEAHGLTEQAQDVFLADTEYLKPNIYLIMMTTDITNLREALLSRANYIPMEALKQKDLVSILKEVVDQRQLHIQAESEMLNLIAQWADFRPREALNMLYGFRSGSSVSSDMIKRFIGYVSVTDVLPIIKCLADSMSYGLDVISRVTVRPSMVDVFVEILKIRLGLNSYKFTLEEARLVRQEVSVVPEDAIANFVAKVTGAPSLTKNVLIHAFLTSHVNFEKLISSNPEEVLSAEIAQKAEIPTQETAEIPKSAAPTFQQLLRNATRVDREEG